MAFKIYKMPRKLPASKSIKSGGMFPRANFTSIHLYLVTEMLHANTLHGAIIKEIIKQIRKNAKFSPGSLKRGGANRGWRRTIERKKIEKKGN